LNYHYILTSSLSHAYKPPLLSTKNAGAIFVAYTQLDILRVFQARKPATPHPTNGATTPTQNSWPTILPASLFAVVLAVAELTVAAGPITPPCTVDGFVEELTFAAAAA
jgi:hypothetical protein